eukprot:93307-Chlamydomonas_euryale.AAC.6
MALSAILNSASSCQPCLFLNLVPSGMHAGSCGMHVTGRKPRHTFAVETVRATLSNKRHHRSGDKTRQPDDWPTCCQPGAPCGHHVPNVQPMGCRPAKSAPPSVGPQQLTLTADAVTMQPAGSTLHSYYRMSIAPA